MGRKYQDFFKKKMVVGELLVAVFFLQIVREDTEYWADFRQISKQWKPFSDGSLMETSHPYRTMISIVVRKSIQVRNGSQGKW